MIGVDLNNVSHTRGWVKYTQTEPRKVPRVWPDHARASGEFPAVSRGVSVCPQGEWLSGVSGRVFTWRLQGCGCSMIFFCLLELKSRNTPTHPTQPLTSNQRYTRGDPRGDTRARGEWLSGVSGCVFTWLLQGCVCFYFVF